MARKGSLDEDTEAEDSKPAVINKEKVERFVNQYEKLDNQIDKIAAQAAKDMQPFKDDQKAIKKRAAESGIPKKEFTSVLRERKLRRKAEAVRASLNENQQDTFDRIKLALGMQLDLFGATPKPKRSKKAKSKKQEPEAETTAGESFAAEQMGQLHS